MASPSTQGAADVEDVPPDDGEPEERSAQGLSAQQLAAEFGDAVWKVVAEGCGTSYWGTAFAIDNRTLVTNWHVTSIDSAPQLVSRDGRTTLSGRVIGWSRLPDVAIIAVDQDLPTTLEWERARRLGEGQQLVALGYPVPAGDFTVATATIMSFQTDGGHRQAIRADAALDKGNSGGPALTTEGRVAGIATRMEDQGFFQLIPLIYTADYVQPTIDRIIADQSGVEVNCSAAGVLPELPEGWGPWEPEQPTGPFTYGDDAVLDTLWDACDAEDWTSCDDLYYSSPLYSEYETFGGTCGGRASWWGWCETFMASAAVAEPGPLPAEPYEYGDDPDLDALWDACKVENWTACDDLYWEAPFDSRYEDFGGTCGDRLPRRVNTCEWEMYEEPDFYGDDPDLDVLWELCESEDWTACDDLYYEAPFGSRYEEFASTCGDRVEHQYGVCEWAMDQ